MLEAIFQIIKFISQDRRLGVVIEIYLLLAASLILLGLAKRRSNKRRFNLRKVRVSSTLSVGGLAAADVIAGSLGGTATSPMRIMSFEGTYSWIDIAAVNDGAMEFGIAHGNYTAAEIEECLEATTSMGLGNKIARERASRLVRVVGTIKGNPAVVAGESNYNDGRPRKTKLNWLIPSGENISMWVKNSSGAVYITGSSLSVLGHFWVKD